MYAKDKTTIQDRREMLQIKLKTLCAEARFIRSREDRVWGPLREELHNHRIREVRSEARHTHIAYGLIRGRTLEQMEQHSDLRKINWDRVRSMIRKYGPVNFVEPECMQRKPEEQCMKPAGKPSDQDTKFGLAA